MLREIAGYLRLKKEVKSSGVICEKAWIQFEGNEVKIDGGDDISPKCGY